MIWPIIMMRIEKMVFEYFGNYNFSAAFDDDRHYILEMMDRGLGSSAR